MVDIVETTGEPMRQSEQLLYEVRPYPELLFSGRGSEHVGDAHGSLALPSEFLAYRRIQASLFRRMSAADPTQRHVFAHQPVRHGWQGFRS